MTKNRKGLKLRLAEDRSSAHDAVFKRHFFHLSSPYLQRVLCISWDKERDLSLVLCDLARGNFWKNFAKNIASALHKFIEVQAAL